MTPVRDAAQRIGVDFPALAIVVVLVHPPAIVVAATVLALGRIVVRFCRRAGRTAGV